MTTVRLSFATLATWLATAVVLSGCTVEPYCLVCPPEAVDGGELPDATGGIDAEARDAQLPDALVEPDGCSDGELCNLRDDDCDGLIDEGIDTAVNPEHCGGCGMRCAPIHAFGECVAGMCEVGSCDVGFIDLDDDPETGCEYRCLAIATDDQMCDFRDDDCDGSVDEDVVLPTDPLNCGRCGRVCRSPHSVDSCVDGECTLGMCDPGYYDIDGSSSNGCEYACTITDPPMEGCNLRDDDCDGNVDEGDPGGSVACGLDEGACEMGTTHCVMGAIDCTGDVVQTAELCNGIDDDCDTLVDEGDPEGGRICGSSVGACGVGRQVCTAGALVCTGETLGSAETCNNVDDDCDGMVDEMNPGGGATCGSAVGACETGTLQCARGALTCTGGIGPIAELCNGIDDDCDTMIDDGDPEAGALCGTDVGRCAPGVQRCTAGALSCIGQITPATETCDGTDEDCDGMIDDGNPGGGASCGVATGECSVGAVSCVTGTLVCSGDVGPRVEVCNGLNDDCDVGTDEGFVLATDIQNCGMCGRVCALANTAQQCTAGVCRIGGCRSGFVDLDGMAATGCEYACSFSGAEACNGRDDDCDGRTDEGLVGPSLFCNPNGVCSGTAASCGGTAGWVCNYPATFQSTETRCDGVDNDCDGRSDESFPLVTTACGNGSGACRRAGTYVCNVAGTGVSCNAPAAGTPADESCNGIDDDCDGLVDEPGVDNPLTTYRDAIDASAIPNVSLTSGGRTVLVMQYEASRPDATATSAGSISTLACSRPNVQPWTSVTHAQAEAACCALNAGGTCVGSTGWRLCGAEEWEDACQGPAGTCDHSYASSCGSSQRMTCNGMEYDSSGATPGDQDALFTTGSSTFAMCYTDWAAAGRIYDMSGNAKEWTSTAVGTGIYEVRGGSYQSIEAGRACDFDFTVAEQSFSAPTTGFRCCMY